MNTTKRYLLNGLFALTCLGLFLFLYKAPPETTPHYPQDDTHLPYYSLKKKEAEKHCGECHSVEGTSPLPENHPPPHRCLFCHKRE